MAFARIVPPEGHAKKEGNADILSRQEAAADSMKQPHDG